MNFILLLILIVTGQALLLMLSAKFTIYLWKRYYKNEESGVPRPSEPSD